MHGIASSLLQTQQRHVFVPTYVILPDHRQQITPRPLLSLTNLQFLLPKLDVVDGGTKMILRVTLSLDKDEAQIGVRS